ncbi:MAG: helix-turn-helix domain-containing protein [Oscillibacter sp.]|nr:helix-turn-helix domain-containing protein [Oscillibacter sp.]
MVFRVDKTKNYTVMSNYHLRDKRLSLQARGLLSQILSLPEDWNYTARGLAAINKETFDTIRGIILELEKAGYIVRRQTRRKSGKWNRMIYDIYEMPQDVTPEEPEEPKEAEEPETSSVPPRESEPDRPKLDPDALNRFRREIRENIDYELLWREFDADPEIVTGYVELMAETCAAKSPIHVNGQEISPKEAQKRFLSLNMNHILYVMECLRDRTHGIRNIRAYTLATLYNAPTTIEQYYETKVYRDRRKEESDD